MENAYQLDIPLTTEARWGIELGRITNRWLKTSQGNTMAGREDIFQKAMKTGHSTGLGPAMGQGRRGLPESARESSRTTPKALSSLGLALSELQALRQIAPGISESCPGCTQ